jgi:hypothetical protein
MDHFTCILLDSSIAMDSAIGVDRHTRQSNPLAYSGGDTG